MTAQVTVSSFWMGAARLGGVSVAGPVSGESDPGPELREPNTRPNLGRVLAQGIWRHVREGDADGAESLVWAER